MFIPYHNLGGVCDRAFVRRRRTPSRRGNRLIRRNPDGSAVAYLPGGWELAKSSSGALTCTRYYTHNGKTVAARGATGHTWQGADLHGTATTTIDPATLAVTTRRTMPFGQPRGPQPTWPTDKGYAGGTQDPTGLTHLGAREYDPTTGRFISVDPVMNLTDPQQWNAYAYAGNNPTTLSDPTGLVPPTWGPACGPDGIDCGLEPAPDNTPTTTPPPPPPPQCTPSTPEYCHQPGSKTEGPYDVIEEWFNELVNGMTPKDACVKIWTFVNCVTYKYYREGDAMTRLLQATDGMAYVYLRIEEQLKAGATEGDANYHYADLSMPGNAKQFTEDFISNATRGIFASDRIEAMTGSFDADWKVVGYEGDGNPVVEINVQNATTLYSGTRVPGLTPTRGDGMAGSGADASFGEYYQVQSYRFRVTF
jgi:RHS repeat-associated protein